MHAALTWYNRSLKLAKPHLFEIEDFTAPDMVELLTLWHTNPAGVPYAIYQESDRTLNHSDVDIWM